MTIVYHRELADSSPNTEAFHNTKTLSYKKLNKYEKLIMNEKWLGNFDILRNLCHCRDKNINAGLKVAPKQYCYSITRIYPSKC